MVFVTFFPSCANVHLTKDVGMIPYVLHREFGYTSYIVSYSNEGYPSLQTEVPGLRMLFMKRSAARIFGSAMRPAAETYRPLLGILRSLPTILDAAPVMVRLARQIRVLHLFHLKFESIILALVYRLINRKGIVYLKMDIGRDISVIHHRDRFWPIAAPLLRPLFQLISFDIISVETREQYELARKHSLLSKFADCIVYLPNGVDCSRLLRFACEFDEKENRILHVGRIGAFPKRSEIVVEAFAKVSSDFPEWRLLLIGPLETRFAAYLQRLIQANPAVRGKIVHVGSIDGERERLYEHYGRAKILAFPSKWESFGFVILEAGCLGDTIVGTDIPSVRDATNDGKFGYVCQGDDVDSFAEALRHALSSRDELEQKSKSMAEFVANNFDWKAICGVLHQNIQRRSRNRDHSRWKSLSSHHE
jgi:glycosyltransferase involved in cell wall biosynthesis